LLKLSLPIDLIGATASILTSLALSRFEKPPQEVVERLSRPLIIFV
jgi:hypothetical protein